MLAPPRMLTSASSSHKRAAREEARGAHRCVCVCVCVSVCVSMCAYEHKHGCKHKNTSTTSLLYSSTLQDEQKIGQMLPQSVVSNARIVSASLFH